MPRFALLEHTGAPDDPGGRHFDLLLEAGEACRTWRLLEIPQADGKPGDEDRIAHLNLSLYGTRDAAQNCIAEYISFLTSIGFATGVASTCSFWRKERELHFSVHGNDFAITGPEGELLSLETQMKNK